MIKACHLHVSIPRVILEKATNINAITCRVNSQYPQYAGNMLNVKPINPKWDFYEINSTKNSQNSSYVFLAMPLLCDIAMLARFKNQQKIQANNLIVKR